MESVLVPTELPYSNIKHYSARDSSYNIDFWKELKKRWMVGGVLAAVLLAAISPRVGAPGGPLHTEYWSYVPLCVIYFGAGARLPAGRRPPLGLCVAAALHAHVAAPALAVCATTMLGGALHGPVVSGALLASLGGGCAWLTLALSQRGAAALVAAGCYLTSLVATPLSVLLLCGRTAVGDAGCVLAACGALVPLAAGAAARRRLVEGAAARRRLRRQRAADRAAALALLYAECCARLADAEGSLYVGDLLATLFVEVLWVSASACVCACYARWWGPHGARLVALCAVPKALDAAGYGYTACAAPALSRLPGALAAPAQALLLAALHAHHDTDDDDDDDDWGRDYHH